MMHSMECLFVFSRKMNDVKTAYFTRQFGANSAGGRLVECC